MVTRPRATSTETGRSTWSANPFTSRAIEVIDWNRDGRDDILALSEGPARAGAATTVYQPGKRIYLAGPKGWSLAKGSDAADSTVGDTIALGDFNADGKTDFITGVSLAGGKSLLNIAESDTKWTVSAVQSLRQGALVRGVAAADLNGDRRDDMFVSWINTEYGVVRSGIDLLLSMPGGWSLIGLWSFEGRLAVRALGIGDLNADGNHDVVGFTDDAQPVVLLGHGKGKFTLESPDGIDSESIGCAGYHVELVDLDHDGRDEILVGFAGERCSGQGSLRAWKAGPRQQK
jgi:hypothetical protein